MAKPWAQVAASPQYQALPPEQREAARRQYFDQVVAPQIGDPSQVESARAQFDAQTGAKASTPANNSDFARLITGKPKDKAAQSYDQAPWYQKPFLPKQAPEGAPADYYTGATY